MMQTTLLSFTKTPAANNVSTGLNPTVMTKSNEMKATIVNKSKTPIAGRKRKPDEPTTVPVKKKKQKVSDDLKNDDREKKQIEEKIVKEPKSSKKTKRRFPKGTLLKDVYPQLIPQIHPTENPQVNVDTLTWSNSKINIVWYDPTHKTCNERKWTTKVSGRVPYANLIGKTPWDPSPKKGIKHKYCTCDFDHSKNPNSKLFMHVHPKGWHEIDRKFHPDENENKRITMYSKQDIHFICSTTPECKVCGDPHTWIGTPANRTYCAQNTEAKKNNCTGCPVCLGSKPCRCHMLEFTHPEIFEEIDRTKHKEEDLDGLHTGCTFTFNFHCSKCPQCPGCGTEHKWEQTIDCRTRKGYGCPWCNGTRRRCQCSSLAKNFPELLLEWDTKANGDLDPSTIPAKTNTRINWICKKKSCRYRWNTQLCSRTVNMTECPQCRRHQTESGFEKSVRMALEAIDVKNVPNHRMADLRTRSVKGNIGAPAFDFYLQRYKAFIEADGEQHHRETGIFYDSLANIRRRDLIKNDYCHRKGYHLLRISWSKRHDVKDIINAFLTKIRHSKTRVEEFIGVEYDPTTYKLIPD
jgi:very-short-patch-repair endonuclease